MTGTASACAEPGDGLKGGTIRLKKSRSGCVTCKARRVKCDEIKPVCGNCKRRFVGIDRCEYSSVTARRRVAQATSRKSDVYLGDPTYSVSLHPPAMEQAAGWRSLELFLMHHYTRHVAATMSPCGGPINMWLDIIPRLSFDSEVVLNPLLALSAIHLRANASSDPRLSVAAARYLDKTIVGHRTALASFQGALVEQVWLSAVMLANLCWLVGQEHHDEEPYELPTLYWTVKDSLTQLYLAQHDSLEHIGYLWVRDEPLPDEVPTENLPEDEQRQMQAIERELSALWQGFNVSAADPARKAAYEEARAYVLMVYRGFFSGLPSTTVRRYVGTVTERCKLGFRLLLENQDPLALALLSFLLVVMKAKGLGARWWMNGKGRYEVAARSVLGMRSLMPKEYHWAMQWPCQVLDGDFLLGRSEELIPEDDEDPGTTDGLSSQGFYEEKG